MVVTAYAGLIEPGAREHCDRLAPSVGTFSLASNRALEIADPLLSISLDARPNDLLAGRESRERRDTKVDPTAFPVSGKACGLGVMTSIHTYQWRPDV
jgi:hypothetical protein